MLDLVFAFVAGLLVGWNVLPQPQWVADIVSQVFSVFKKK